MKLLIINLNPSHFEIIESIIVKHHEILNIDKSITLDIYLHTRPNPVFKKYISEKYPNIIFENIKNYDYYIDCTIYDWDFDKIDKGDNSTKRYISHEITERLKTNPNVYFLTPLQQSRYIYADVLPYSENKTKNNTPIYIIQGNLNQNRRCLALLKKILAETYEHNFIIKLVGRGYLPRELIDYKDKIVLRNNLDFNDYHKEFLDAYCILPLISKKTHPQYYTKKLTSTISYARGYNLKCLIDNDLQEIYNLSDVETYNDINDIVSAFKRTLEDFYKTK